MRCFQSESDELDFDLPLEDLERLCNSAESMLGHRAKCSAAYRRALDEYESQKFIVDHPSPKTSSQKLSTASENLKALESQVAKSRALLDECSRTTSSELERFQESALSSLKTLAVFFAKSQFDFLQKSLQSWQPLVSSEHI